VIWASLARALWKPIAAILAALGIYLAGRNDARQRAKSEALKDYAETRKKADAADIIGDDPDLARRWLRERGQRDSNL
jgi:hypothetical protein